MSGCYTLLREVIAQPLTPAAAVDAGLILPAGHALAGRPVYSSTAWAEEAAVAGEADWAGAALLLAAGAMQRRQTARRLCVRWRVGAAVIPTAVAIEPNRGLILLMLDGE